MAPTRPAQDAEAPVVRTSRPPSGPGGPARAGARAAGARLRPSRGRAGARLRGGAAARRARLDGGPAHPRRGRAGRGLGVRPGAHLRGRRGTARAADDLGRRRPGGRRRRAGPAGRGDDPPRVSAAGVRGGSQPQPPRWWSSPTPAPGRRRRWPGAWAGTSYAVAALVVGEQHDRAAARRCHPQQPDGGRASTARWWTATPRGWPGCSSARCCATRSSCIAPSSARRCTG